MKYMAYWVRFHYVWIPNDTFYMLWSTVKLLLAIFSNVNYFWSIKTLPRSSKSCDCVTFRVLKYLLSTFLLYTPHCHMIVSKQKCCLLSTGVSTESQNLTSVLHLRQDFLATRNMTRIDVGPARSYVKLLLSSWKTYICAIWWHGISTNSRGFLWALTVLHL